MRHGEDFCSAGVGGNTKKYIFAVLFQKGPENLNGSKIADVAQLARARDL